MMDGAPAPAEGHDPRDEYIKLDSFLKLARVVQTGGHAKVIIQAGEVKVNGAVETRRGRKLRKGDVVEVAGEVLIVDVE
jgi:ribosome-associated protein